MGKHNFGYFLHEGVSNMFSHGFMSFAAIGITVACLLIMGTFTLVAVNANGMLRDLEQENEIVAYVDDSYSTAEARSLQVKLASLPNVASADFITRQAAMRAFSEKYADEALFQDLDPEILRDRYSIKIQDLELLADTAKAVKEIEGIDDVNAYEEIAGGFITVRNIASVVCIALIAILFIVSVFIISNTIKLTTFDRREEIAIMRMVGATNGFVRVPFIVEGILIGVFSGGISATILYLGYDKVVEIVYSITTFLTVIDIEPYVWWLYGGYLLAGALFGIMGGVISIGKYLKKEGEKLCY